MATMRAEATGQRTSAGRWRDGRRREACAAAGAPLLVPLLTLLLAACGNGTHAGASATATPGGTPAAGPQLAWHAAAGVPPANYAVAPGDGDVAYACVGPTDPADTHAHVYVTRDRVASWAHAGDFPVGARPPSNGKPFNLNCALTIDANDPATATAVVIWLQNGEAGIIPKTTTFASFDYGAHWQKLSGPVPFVLGPDLASGRDGIYAELGADTGPSGLSVSHDKMRTWQPVDTGIGHPVAAFWLDPNTGALLARAHGDDGFDHELYASADGGQHWTHLPAPAADGFVVRAPRAGTPWHLCGETVGQASPPTTPSRLMCSADGGQTWRDIPLFSITERAPKGFSLVESPQVFAIAGDGALLASIHSVSGQTTIYRLPAGATAWQSLGPLPPPSYIPAYYPTPDGGMLSYLNLSVGGPVMVAAYP